MTAIVACRMGCPKEGAWRSGYCPTCRAYFKRAEARPAAWSVARRETIARWDARLALVLERRQPRKVLPFRRRA